jgi:ATP-binding protein involved in chromosome partitioning
MPSENEMMNALSAVIDPELGRSIVELKMVRDLIWDSSGVVSFNLVLTIPGCPLKDQMASDARKVLMALPGVKDVVVNFSAMTEAEKKAAFAQGRSAVPKLNQFNQVRQIIAVMSGKGGVGKSTVTAMLAVALCRKGLKVGILDADITGSSIPKLFGLPSGGLRSAEQGMLPAVTGIGLKVVSINLLLKGEDVPVIWRGPMISSAIRQFWGETLWGKLDYLLIDLPPGTSDAALSVMQDIPIDGVLLVTTPQGLSAMVVRKAVHMIRQLNIRVLGLVENLSYFICPDNGKRYDIFGPSHSGEIAEIAGAPAFAALPIDPVIAAKCDAGRVEDVVSAEIDRLVEQIIK